MDKFEFKWENYPMYNLVNFLNEMNKSVLSDEFETEKISIVSLEEYNILEEIENSIFICSAVCPFCSRICDSVHETRLSRHEC